MCTPLVRLKPDPTPGARRLKPDPIMDLVSAGHHSAAHIIRPVSYAQPFAGLLILALLLSLGRTAAVQQGGTTTQPSNTTVAGELLDRAGDAHQPGIRVVHPGRCQPQRRGRRVVQESRAKRAWRDALPLLRLQGERIYAESRVDVIAPNMFAGSVLDLEPGTAVRSPTGDDRPRRRDRPSTALGTRESRRVVTVRTRAEPMPFTRRPHVSRLPAWLQRDEDSSRRSKG